MSVASLLTGITFTLWGLSLLGILAVSSVVLGLFALVTGIVWLVSSFYPLNVPVRRG